MDDNKKCRSCGMPMETAEDFGAGDIHNAYCVQCTDENGVLKPYKQLVDEFTKFTAEHEGVDESIAREMVVQGLSMMPEWKDR